MDIHINKKIAGLMLGSLLVGGAIGGAVGFASGSEEGGHHERRGNMERNGGYDNEKDGETSDDQGGAPNSDEQVTKTDPTMMQNGSAVASLGDLSAFRVIAQDTLNKLNAGDQKDATTRITDLETAWDQADPVLKAKNGTQWTMIDKKIDTVLRELRAGSPNVTTEKSALGSLLLVLQ